MKQYFRAKSTFKSKSHSARSFSNKLAAALCLSAALSLAFTVAAQRKSGGHPQSSQSQSPDSGATQKGAPVTQAKGTFDVKLDPQGEADKAEGSTLARMSLDKKSPAPT